MMVQSGKDKLTKFGIFNFLGESHMYLNMFLSTAYYCVMFTFRLES